ncbi:MAG: hypothetical protein ACPGUC_00310 [Gammaproteobacteria bacterium]
MGRSVRVYCFDLEGRIHSVPLALADALERGEGRSTRLARATVRFAELVVEWERRRPVDVLREVYYLQRFDERGYLDVARLRRERLAMADMLVVPGAGSSPAVVASGHRFVQRGRFWQPSREQCTLIHGAVFGRFRVPRLRAD